MMMETLKVDREVDGESADELSEEVSDEEYSDDDERGGASKGGKIPYVAVYDPDEDAVHARGYFIDGIPVEVSIVHVERDSHNHHLNPYLYTLDMTHGQYKWSIRRRYNEFQHLHRRMLLHRANERFKAPVRRLEERIEELAYHGEDEELKEGSIKRITAQSEQAAGPPPPSSGGGQAPLARGEGNGAGVDEAGTGTTVTPATPKTATNGQPKEPPNEAQAGNQLDESRGELKKSEIKLRRLPKFPLFPDAIVQDNQLDERKIRLEKYLRQLLRIAGYRNHPETAEFFEVCRLSFVNNLGPKTKEGLVKKRPGGRKAYVGMKRFCIEHCAKWSKRWLVVKDSFIAYIDPRKEEIRAVILYDSEFVLRVGASQTEGIKHGLLISNFQRDLLLRVDNDRKAEEWKEAIEQTTHADKGPGRIWLTEKRFGSSYPVRNNTYATWFSDAKYHWEHAANMMELAKEEIFIADWWLSPEIYMKRPMVDGNRWLLTDILKRRAEAGIRIFVLLYKEVEMALGINSLYSKRVLQSLHPNIRVLRHPDHVPGGQSVLLWAHHEKLIIIDQNVAFVGGIDLCYGRWDDHNHRLTDLGSVKYHTQHSIGAAHSLVGGMRQIAQIIPTLSPTLSEANAPEFTGNPKQLLPSASVDEIETIHLQDIRNGQTAASNAEKRDKSGDDDEVVVEETDEKKGGDGQSDRTTTSSTAPLTSAAVAAFKSRGGGGGRPKPGETSDLNATDSGGGGPSSSANPNAPQRKRSRFKSMIGKMKVQRSFSEAADGGPPGAAAAAGGKVQKPDWSLLMGKGGAGGGGDGVDKVDFSSIVQQAAKGGRLSRDSAMSQLDASIGSAVSPRDAFMESYKDYVNSGQAAKDKIRGDTPPPERKKRNKMRAMLGHWKEERRRRQKTALEEDINFAREYEAIWRELAKEEEGRDEADVNGMGKLWIGKDYVNFIFKDFTDLDMPFMDFIDRGMTCRMPWHDIHSVVYGTVARDVARHFIQRWNVTKVEKVKDDEKYPFLVPKSYAHMHVPRFFRQMSHKVLRSSCLWSAGINTTEDSIQQAYLHMIANAQHYVYIENQFFVSLLDSTEVHNEISKALLQRIVRAHNNGEKFRVYVMLPLMPAFEGQIGATGGSALQAVLYWTYQSISNGPHSLLTNLASQVDDPSRYIVFSGLRKHDELSGKLITELLYIHSKLIIVDDRVALIGSANINDRSQLGKRDSEMAVYVEDCEYTDVQFDGKPAKSGKFCGSLRRWLFREHLGLLNPLADPRKKNEEEWLNEAGREIDVSDPVSDQFYLQTWLRHASKNTDIFEKVFRCLPTDQVLTFEDLPSYAQQIPLAELNKEAAATQLKRVQGSIVLFPTQFLGNSSLAPSIMTKEGMAPSSLFT